MTLTGGQIDWRGIQGEDGGCGSGGGGGGGYCELKTVIKIVGVTVSSKPR